LVTAKAGVATPAVSVPMTIMAPVSARRRRDADIVDPSGQGSDQLGRVGLSAVCPDVMALLMLLSRLDRSADDGPPRSLVVRDVVDDVLDDVLGLRAGTVSFPWMAGAGCSTLARLVGGAPTGLVGAADEQPHATLRMPAPITMGRAMRRTRKVMLSSECRAATGRRCSRL
jgi:hypothetical protein